MFSVRYCGSMYDYPVHWSSTWTGSLWCQCVETWLCTYIHKVLITNIKPVGYDAVYSTRQHPAAFTIEIQTDAPWLTQQWRFGRSSVSRIVRKSEPSIRTVNCTGILQGRAADVQTPTHLSLIRRSMAAKKISARSEMLFQYLTYFKYNVS